MTKDGAGQSGVRTAYFQNYCPPPQTPPCGVLPIHVRLTLADVSIAQSGTYRLNVCDSGGCQGTDIRLLVEEPARLASGVSNGAVNFTLAGRVGAQWIVEGSTNLQSWTPLHTNTIPPDGAFRFEEALTDTMNRRYYRAVAR